MKNVKLVITFLFLIFALSTIFLLQHSKADVIKSKYFNYVEKGGRTVKTSPSTQYKLMETYPQATITVYEAGTLNLATIWADRDGLILKANPFTADTDSFFYFYVDCGKYDIKFSEGGIVTPYTWGDVFICGTLSSGGGTVTGSGTENFITKWVSNTELGDSVLFNPLNVQAGNLTLIGWTSGLPTASLDVALGRDSAGKIEINNGTQDSLASLTLHRIEPTPTVTIPGLNFGTIAGDPSAPVIGDCWYNTSLSAFRCFNGSTVTLSTGSGITSINTLTAAAQFLVVGASGSDFNISSTTATHTFNIPSAGIAIRGLVSTAAQSFSGKKTFTPTSIFAGFNFGTLSGDPSTVVNGDCWYNTVLEKYRCVEDSTVVNIINPGGTIINPTDTFIPYRFNATTFSDSRIRREGTNTTGITGGLNTPQIFNIYINDATQTTGNYQKLMFQYIAGTPGEIEMFSDASGESPLEIRFGVAGSSNRLYLGTGNIRPSTARAYDLGTGSLQFDETFTFALELDAAGTIHWGSKAKISSPTDGILEVQKSSSGAGASNGNWRFISISPTAITGDQNNYTIATNTKYVRFDTTGALAINGFATTPTQVQGQEHIFINISANDITFPNESGSATATNRFTTDTGLSIVLSQGEMAFVWYDDITFRWRITEL